MIMAMSTDAPSEAAVDAWAALMRAGHVVFTAIESDLKSAGFPPLVWYDALLELRRVGADRMRPMELERHTLLAQYGVSRLVARLAGAGYLTISPCADDRRGHELQITESGRALLADMWPAYAAAIQRHFGGHISDADAATLARLLRGFVPSPARSSLFPNAPGCALEPGIVAVRPSVAIRD